MSQKYKHELFSDLITSADPGSVFVEIGSERGEGSTKYLSEFAKLHNVDFLTVDIDDKLSDANINAAIKKEWNNFYSKVKDNSWPGDVENINQLSKERQEECLVVHNWARYEQEIISSIKNLYSQDHVTFYCSSGSEWCKEYKNIDGRKISLLYLDNYDVIIDPTAMSDEFLKEFISDYKTNFNIELNNVDCQVEHFKQLVALEPFLSENCIIGLDDTFLYNNFWIGKSGPGVIFLLSLGYKIILINDRTVFLCKS